MGSLPYRWTLSGERCAVPFAPLQRHFERNLEVAKCWDNLAVIYEDEACKVQLSYRELNERANRLARSLAARARLSQPNSDGDYIFAICMKPSPNTIVALLAAWKAGGAYVPLEPSFPQSRVSHILADASPALVLYDATAKPSMFAESGVPSVSFEEVCDESADRSGDNLSDGEQLPHSEERIAIVLYTSGSTGIPKGVRLPHACVCNRVWWQYRRFPLSAAERCAWKTSLTFVDAVCELWAPLLAGGVLLVLSRSHTTDPQRLVAALAQHEIQRLVLVPTLLQSILMYLSLNPSERPLKKLKLWVCSGETLTKDLAGRFFKYFGDDQGYQLANFYGSTEVMGDVTYHVLERSEQLGHFNSIPIGVPLDNCTIYLLDPELNPVRPGEASEAGGESSEAGGVGEVWVAGSNLAAGYVGNREPDRFCDNPHANHPDFKRMYRTGDFGVIDKGHLLYTGRTDSQIKIRGHRVDLQEVNAAVSALEWVDKGVVLCYGAESGSPALLAFVVGAAGARLAPARLEAALALRLTHYQMPQVIVVDSIPLLVNGKVDRQALLKMYENTNNNDDASIPIDIDYSGVRAEDMEKARVLFETVGDVLGRAARGDIGLKANFYELGGNSLNSIYTITKLREKGYYIDISEFLSAATLGEVLMSMGGACRTSSEAPTFTVEPLDDSHEKDVIDMIVTSFYEKADLERWLKREIQPADYGACVRGCWPGLRRAGLSLLLRDGSGPAAVALNFDARAEPDVELNGGLAKIMTFLEFVEGPVRDSLLPPGEGTVLHSFMMATASRLSARENVAAIRALEEATCRVARRRAFHGVFTTNTSPLTQQLGTDVLGFQTLLDYQVNHYVAPDGDRPFADAPDDQRAIVCWKPVH